MQPAVSFEAAAGPTRTLKPRAFAGFCSSGQFCECGQPPPASARAAARGPLRPHHAAHLGRRRTGKIRQGGEAQLRCPRSLSLSHTHTHTHTYTHTHTHSHTLSLTHTHTLGRGRTRKIRQGGRAAAQLRCPRSLTPCTPDPQPESGKSETPTPQPSNRKPETLKPLHPHPRKPQTPNPKPQTPNPKPQTPNPQTPNPRSQTSNPKP